MRAVVYDGASTVLSPHDGRVESQRVPNQAHTLLTLVALPFLVSKTTKSAGQAKHAESHTFPLQQ